MGLPPKRNMPHAKMEVSRNEQKREIGQTEHIDLHRKSENESLSKRKRKEDDCEEKREERSKRRKIEERGRVRKTLFASTKEITMIPEQPSTTQKAQDLVNVVWHRTEDTSEPSSGLECKLPAGKQDFSKCNFLTCEKGVAQ